VIKIASVIEAVINLKDNVSASLKNINGNFSQFQRQASYTSKSMVKVGKEMHNVGKTLSMTVTAPILAVGAGLLKLGQDFQTAGTPLGLAPEQREKPFKILITISRRSMGRLATTWLTLAKQ